MPGFDGWELKKSVDLLRRDIEECVVKHSTSQSQEMPLNHVNPPSCIVGVYSTFQSNIQGKDEPEHCTGV